MHIQLIMIVFQYLYFPLTLRHTRKKACYSCNTYNRILPLVDILKKTFLKQKMKLSNISFTQLKKVSTPNKRPMDRTIDFDLSPDFKQDRYKEKKDTKIQTNFSISNPVIQNFLGKIEAHVTCLIEQIFRQYERVFDKKFKPYFRGKSNIFSKYFSDLEKQIGFNISGTLKNHALLKQFLTPHEFFKGNKSISGMVSMGGKDLLSQNFSSVLSIEKMENEPLNLMLDFTKSHIDNLNKGFDFEEIGSAIIWI